MQTHEALMGRRTVHRFRPADLPEGAVTRALEAAMMAPNHKLTCPWRFFRVGPATRQRLFQIGHRIQAQKSGQAPTAEQDLKLREKLMNPSELVVFARVRTDGRWGDWFPLTMSDDHGPDPGSAEEAQAEATAPDAGTAGSDPTWVGRADA